MECPSCRAEVPEGGKFCMECGTPLPRACPACGHATPGAAKFCPECGAKLGPPNMSVLLSPASVLPAPAVPVSSAERRQLSVMFCDLVGSTALSARLDPEELQGLMRAYQDVCTAAIARFEGRVAKFLGDGVLAYFGWPIAHEDEVERAVRAGLSMVMPPGVV